MIFRIAPGPMPVFVDASVISDPLKKQIKSRVPWVCALAIPRNGSIGIDRLGRGLGGRSAPRADAEMSNTGVYCGGVVHSEEQRDT